MKINKKEILILVFLLSVFLFQSLVVSKNTNLVFDEPGTLTVSYYFVKYKDTSMSVLHPPLGYILAGLPLLFPSQPTSSSLIILAASYKS